LKDGYELPAGWTTALIEEVIAPQFDGKTLHQGWSPQCEKVRCVTPEEWGVLKTTAIQAGEFQPEHHKRLPQHLEPRPAIEVNEGDLLLTCAGPRIRCGVACLVRSTRPRLMLSGKMYRFRAIPTATDARYLESFLQTDAAQTAIDRMKTGGNESGLNLTHDRFKQLQVRIAPYAEQIRIVEKLEELLSDLDAGVAELKAAQRKLTQYRQSLLKAAVEGALTADWRAARAQSGDPQETGAALLQRILTERRTRWEARQLAMFAEQGKMPPKDWRAKYPEPVAPDTADLRALPDGWVWATLSQVGWLDRGRSTHRPRNAPHLYGGAYPFVQTGDIREADTFIREASASYSDAGLAQSRLWPIDTIVITIAANIGKTALLAMEACFPDSVVGFLPATDHVSIRFVEYFMRTAQQKLESEAPATAQKNINLEILERVCLPLPPLQEQLQIVSVVSDALDATREQDAAIELALKQSAAQRKNILKAAFAGQLVPQDPNDEPASALLERIRAERAKQTGAAKPRGRKPRTTA